jgi:hypothetical protein
VLVNFGSQIGGEQRDQPFSCQVELEEGLFVIEAGNLSSHRQAGPVEAYRYHQRRNVRLVGARSSTAVAKAVRHRTSGAGDGRERGGSRGNRSAVTKRLTP